MYHIFSVVWTLQARCSLQAKWCAMLHYTKPPKCHSAESTTVQFYNCTRNSCRL